MVSSRSGYRDVDLAHVDSLELLLDDLDVLANGVADVVDRLRLVAPLRPATRETGDGDTFPRPMKCDLREGQMRISAPASANLPAESRSSRPAHRLPETLTMLTPVARLKVLCEPC
jgi:hypothetical protein